MTRFQVPGVWAHLAVTFDGKNQVLFYINSILRRRIITNSSLPFSRQARPAKLPLNPQPAQSCPSCSAVFICSEFSSLLPPTSRQLLMGRLPRARSSSSSIITDEMWMMPWALKPEVCNCAVVHSRHISILTSSQELRDLMHYEPRFTNAIADGVKNVENRSRTQCLALIYEWFIAVSHALQRGVTPCRSRRYFGGVGDGGAAGLVKDIILDTGGGLNWLTVRPQACSAPWP